MHAQSKSPSPHPAGNNDDNNTPPRSPTTSGLRAVPSKVPAALRKEPAGDPIKKSRPTAPKPAHKKEENK